MATHVNFQVELGKGGHDASLLYSPWGSKAAPIPIAINANSGKGELTLADGKYHIYWLFFGDPGSTTKGGSTIKISYSDDNGDDLRPASEDTIHAGSSVSHSTQLIVPKQGDSNEA